MDKINLLEILNKYLGEIVVIKQEGFLGAQYVIEKMHCGLQDEILRMWSAESGSYVSVNINQIYKVENSEEQIRIYMDNDTVINISKKPKNKDID